MSGVVGGRAAPARGRVLLVAIALALPAALAGCGGDDEGTQSAAVQTTTETRPPQKLVVQTGRNGFNAVDVYRRAAPGVVTVLSIFGGGSSLLGTGPDAGQGSGFVLNEEGDIVTNAHVVSEGRGGKLVKAEQVYVEFADRNRVAAKVLGVDPFADVALLNVNPEGLDLVPIELGDDSSIQVGQTIAAIGSPFGEQQSLSVGIVSAKERSVRSLTQFQIENSIQVDAAINPGNSGGPLLDGEAQVLGINQQIETRSQANAGVGFAVPVSAIKRSIEQLREDGKVEYAYIGVQTQALYPQLADRLGLDTDYGGLLARVVDGGPADQAGLDGGSRSIRFQASRARVSGDVVLAVDGRKVIDPSDLAKFIALYRPGETVTLDVLRDGQRDQVDVTLGTRPTAVSG
ncbi:MAG: trypsin-like peptidase domain-containing protein [Actinomycetota bacterium]